ncbi:Aste57867_8056 [Aphanomyces stellatus]|uniref:Aste57867_8056 protein n=1 Tax=Aphanomyces stellatus TaxID=120398 RepID=A0A485KJ93_9STRA|nr:hypothetical protein As57867_008026 [Aphanomyces stellatus]VFT84948.1 Aste57867_8056 [Aphanomyces stellatus]
MRIFLALKDGAWIPSKSDIIRAMKKGEVCDTIKKLVHEDMELDPADTIGACFVGELEMKKPEIGSRQIHVLVVVSDHVVVPCGRILPKKRKIVDLKDELPAPSSFAKCRGKFSWIRILKKLDGQIECHRMPNSNESTPVPQVLLHETFSRFESNCTYINFDKSDCDFIVEFCNAMSDGYENETDLAEKARDILGHYLLSECPRGGSIVRIEINNSISDGSYLFGNALLLNLEVKVQKGEGGGDPTMQNIAYYVKYLPKKVDRALPCFCWTFAVRS